MSRDKTISILGTDVRVVSYKGEPVVTFDMVDAVHQRVEGTAKRTFSENRERFVEGEDFVEAPYDALWSDEVRTTKGGNRKPINLITRRGYLKLVKPLTDDRAWEVQGEMIDRYFMVEKLAEAGVSRDDLASLIAALEADRREERRLYGAQKKAVTILSENHRAGTQFLNDNLKLIYTNGKELSRLLKDILTILSQQAQTGARGSVSSYCTIRDAVQMIGIPDGLPAYRSLASKAARSLDAHCWRNGVVGETIDASGKAIRLYPKATASDWARSEGRALLERHLAKHRTSPAVVRLPLGEV